MKKLILALLVISTSTLVITSCKKGEDDPFLSLRSRKARVAGEWTCKSIEGDRTQTFFMFGFSDKISYSGSTLVVTPNSSWGSGPINPTKLTYYLKLKFDKEGKFEAEEFMDTITNTITGKWNFLGKMGEEKKKESIVINIESSTVADSSSFFTTCGSTLTFHIKELRNKKMVLYNDSYISASETAKVKLDATYEFEQ